MLPQVHRLNAQIRLGSPTHCSTKYFTLLSKPYQSPWQARVIVSKSTHSKATTRNLIRRRIHHALQNLLPPSTPLHCIILAKPESTRATYQQLYQELTSSFNRQIS